MTLEFSENIRPVPDFNELFRRVHTILSETRGIAIGNCKSRAVKRDMFFVGDGSCGAFVHLDVKILEGRSQEVKQAMGRHFLDLLKEFYDGEAGTCGLQITVEIHDIQRTGYFKHPEGTLPPSA